MLSQNTSSIIYITDGVANQEDPPRSAIHTMIEFFLVDWDKAPGVRLVGIGGITCHLPAKCMMLAICTREKYAYYYLNLFTGLGSRIEGDLHATLEEHSKDQ